MKVSHESNNKAIVLESPEVKNAAMKVLIGHEEGWKDHVLRIIELDEEGYSPKHTHPWAHINYMIEGDGVLFIEGIEHPVKPGSYAFVPEGKLHQFRNTGNGKFRFICIVPKDGHK